MSLVMLIGVMTTLIIAEPAPASRQAAHQEYPVADYVRFFMVFVLSIVCMITVYSLLPDTPVSSMNAPKMPLKTPT